MNYIEALFTATIAPFKLWLLRGRLEIAKHHADERLRDYYAARATWEAMDAQRRALELEQSTARRVLRFGFPEDQEGA